MFLGIYSFIQQYKDEVELYFRLNEFIWILIFIIDFFRPLSISFIIYSKIVFALFSVIRQREYRELCEKEIVIEWRGGVGKGKYLHCVKYPCVEEDDAWWKDVLRYDFFLTSHPYFILIIFFCYNIVRMFQVIFYLF